MVAITLRDDFDAETLRKLGSSSCDAGQTRRLLALAHVYEGASRTEAATMGGMDRQTLRDWVHRFNAQGPDGLINKPSPGRPSSLTQTQKAALAEIVKAGADPEKDGLVRFRLVDLVTIVQEKFKVTYEVSGMWRLLKSMGFSHISARPQHPRTDPQVQEDFKQTFQGS